MKLNCLLLRIFTVVLIFVEKSTTATAEDCSKACQFVPRIKCNPYFLDKNGVYGLTEIDGVQVCRFFNNNCMFSSADCQEKVQCRKGYKKVSKNECISFCTSCNNDACNIVDPECVTYILQTNVTKPRVTYQMNFNNNRERLHYECVRGLVGDSSIKGVCNEC